MVKTILRNTAYPDEEKSFKSKIGFKRYLNKICKDFECHIISDKYGYIRLKSNEFDWIIYLLYNEV